MTGEYGIRPEIQHYNCIVDLLGCAGLLEEAESLIEDSDFKDDSCLWAVILAACSTSTNSSTAERIAREVIQLTPHQRVMLCWLMYIKQ